MAKVHGIKLTKTTPLAAATTVSAGGSGGWSSSGFSNMAPAASTTPVATSSTSKGFKSGGWATVGSAASLPNPPTNPGGWSAIGSASTSSAPLPVHPPPPNEPAPPPPPPSTSKVPAFRSSGWAQMDHLTDVRTIVDTDSPSVNAQPYTSMDYEMDHTPPPPPPASIPPPPPAMDLAPPLPVNHPPPAVAATPGWRTHFAPSPSPSAFGLRGAQSERDGSLIRGIGFGGDTPWTNNPSSPSAPKKRSHRDGR